MKKFLYSMAFLGMFVLSLGGLMAQTEPEPPTLEEPCKDKIERQGSLIIVTVCERRTSILGGLAGLSCDVVSIESCSFTNT